MDLILPTSVHNSWLFKKCVPKLRSSAGVGNEALVVGTCWNPTIFRFPWQRWPFRTGRSLSGSVSVKGVDAPDLELSVAQAVEENTLVWPDTVDK